LLNVLVEPVQYPESRWGGYPVGDKDVRSASLRAWWQTRKA
jgi:hypothetical protein